MAIFLGNIVQLLNGVASEKDRRSIRQAVEPLADCTSSQCLTPLAPVISSGGATTAKTGATDMYFTVDGKTVLIAASTTLPALAGVVTAAYFNVWCFFVDAGGTVTSQAGTQGSTLALMKWPQFPKNKALVASLIITYASTFTGGTTPLDTATTVYVPSTGAFNPNAITG